MNAQPGTVPAITRSTLPLENRHRIQLWRVRTAMHGSNSAPPLFQPFSLAGWNRQRSSLNAPIAARPGRSLPTGQGTYSDISADEARLILRFMTAVAAGALVALMICVATS